MTPENPAIDPLKATRQWVERFVIGLNLCPFAGAAATGDRIRYVLSEARDIDVLYQDLLQELSLLVETDVAQVETTVLVHPHVLEDFELYLDFLEIVEEALEEAELEGILQVASFHPQYQFEDTEADDVSNYTNRSPFPMLHILREESLSTAIDHYPDPEGIPARNIQKMHDLGLARVLALRDEAFQSFQ
jgi:hypothetical protein